MPKHMPVPLAKRVGLSGGTGTDPELKLTVGTLTI